MKKLFALILFFIAIEGLFAQEGEDVGWVARFGAAGGVSPSYIFPNLEMLNKNVKSFGLPELSNGMFLFGGGGYAYVMFIDNLRIGGIGLGGSQSTDGRVKDNNSNTFFDREIQYSYNFGGLTIEYTLPFVKNIALSIGGIIGGGTQSIQIFQNTGGYSWDTSWPQNYNPASSSISYNAGINTEIKNSFFTFTPTINLDIPLNRFIAFRIGSGYVINFSDNWKVNNNQNIVGVPNDLCSNNFFIQTGIYFGFFAF